MTLLVTGAAGFVGEALVRDARQRQLGVVATDLENGIDVARLDVRRRDDVALALAGTRVDTVIHAAAVTHGEPDAIEDVNVAGTRNVLEAARGAKLRRLVYLSSGAVYGVPEPCPESLDENAPLAGAGTYAKSKIEAETLCRFAAEEERLSIVVVRLGSLYGPTERAGRDRHFVSIPRRIADLADAGGSFRAHGLAVARAYAHVDDAARTVVDLARVPRARLGDGPFRVFNFDGPERTSLGEILQLASGLRPGLRYEPVDDPRNADIALSSADERPRLETDRVQAVLGPLERRSIEMGLMEMLLR